MWISYSTVRAKATVLVDTGIFFAYYSLRDRYHMDSVALIIHVAEGRWEKHISRATLSTKLKVLKYRVSSDFSYTDVVTIVTAKTMNNILSWIRVIVSSVELPKLVTIVVA